MFERFTDRARRVVVLAQEEARLLDHNYIGTEHILLALISEQEGVAAQALEQLDVSYDAVRAEILEIIGQGRVTAPSDHIPFTPRSKKVLELSLREALQLGHSYIGTEHILLGLVREGGGVATQILVKLGASLERVRQKVIEVLAGYTPRISEAASATETVATPVPVIAALPIEEMPGCPSCGNPLRDHLGWRMVAAKGPEGEMTVETQVAYCDLCGRSLGILNT